MMRTLRTPAEPAAGNLRPVAWIGDRALQEAIEPVEGENGDWGPLKRPVGRTAGRTADRPAAGPPEIAAEVRP